MPSDYRSATPIPKTVAGASLAEVDAFLQLLARAVRQFHTYPPTSPMCTESVAACHKAFAALDCADWLVLRVTPHEFIYDEAGIGAGTLVEHELVRRLHRAHVAALHFDRSASLRDFTRLCADIIRGADLPSTETTFAELLADHGVETIVPRMAHRPEVLQVGARPAAAWDLVEHEVSRRRAATPVGPVQYLYPPEKGWVRLDPETSVDSVSLVDLAVLVDDPAQIATMLLRLTDDDPSGGRAPEQALEQKFSDVAMLFAALDGHLARLMFDKLARAVLALRPERRRDLLQRTILPGLLDGRADGAVLRDFPDPDLADSLCLLLDLETAAPEVVTAAMNRLDLPEDRRQSVAALVETRLQAGSGARDGEPEHGTERYARRLIRIDAAQSRTFAEFSAFDLAMDDTATVTVAEVCRAIGSTDGLSEQVDCLWRLTSIEPNPALVEGFMRRALALTAQLDRAGRWADLAAIVLRFRQTAETLKETRPDVRDAVMTGLGSFCSRGRMSALLDLHERDDPGREQASLVFEAFGEAIVPGCLAVIEEPGSAGKATALTAIMCKYAHELAARLASELGRCRPVAARAIVRVLGHAGAGYETAVADQLGSRDDQTVREALRALARIGTARAASLVASQIRDGSPFARSAAEEALWHLSPAQTSLQLRDLLGRREFVQQNPQTAARLLDRAAQTGASGLDGVLGDLASLRFRFWSPALVRVAWKARELRDR